MKPMRFPQVPEWLPIRHAKDYTRSAVQVMVLGMARGARASDMRATIMERVELDATELEPWVAADYVAYHRTLLDRLVYYASEGFLDDAIDRHRAKSLREGGG